ncbi:D-alanyl-D-alanine carboxypeptidase family protein [Oceanospirillum beijerinckii]|uniref:D-alanyl-D-alanine carboxypeptidase family protein n=1 Tax=Oceanospirillum beijerinckii TaxID=64976 RepID=UPI00041161B7|nr:D-alanyl-D-alanine carboxypeptidase family protein [Oceanospirillum beijerinckii]
MRIFRQLQAKTVVIATTLSLLFSITAQAAALIPAAPKLAANSYILVDADSGRVLVEHNADKRLPPASLTKMMTAYLVEAEIAKGSITPEDKVRISVKAWKAPGSRMFIKEGDSVAISDLLKGIIIQSGNDASVAVAEHIGGSEDAFADLMTQQARVLGMENTQYANATGLPADGHFSTARDLSLLADHIIKDFPEQYSVYAEKYFTYNGIRQPNRNRLLWRDKSVDGLKTGHTEEAGYCLVASASRSDMRLISVVMGTKSDEARSRESQKLLAYGFRYFETLKPYSSGDVLNEPRLWAGEKEKVKLGIKDDLYMTIPRGQAQRLTAKLNVNKVIKAPVQAGQNFGVVQISLDGEVLAERPLVALESVQEGGFFKRLWDSIVMFFTELVG